MNNKNNVLKLLHSINLNNYDLDLLNIVAYSYFEDRNNLRKNLRRVLNVKTPVSDPDFWESSKNLLTDCLYLLTGDIWNFEFFHQTHQQNLNLNQKNIFEDLNEYQSVIPYSGGLDSLACCRLEEAMRPLPVCVKMTSRLQNAVSKTMKYSKSKNIIFFNMNIQKPTNKESSCYSRSFIFLVSAALVAKKLNIKTVIVPENGQSSLAPSLIVYGQQHPMLGTNPKFTRSLKIYLDKIWGNESLS